MKDWNINDLKSKGFRTGTIIRVSMHNFLTFDDAEVFPGPGLNVVLGPNGTGKSSVTHAICLACGGDPKTVGRSGDLKQFVKRGKEGMEAFCEVDIFRGNNVVTVRRIINSEKKSSKWTINGRTDTETSVMTIMSSLSIDVDNLCSFMAQDKVGEFTRQSANGILRMTLQSIKSADPEKTLHDEQVELADVETEKLNRERKVREKSDLVQSLQKEIDSMRAEVERTKRRADLQELLGLYEIRLVGIKLELKVAEKIERQNEVDEVNQQMQQAQRELKPLEEEEMKLKRQQALKEKSLKTARDKYRDKEIAVVQCKERIEELDVALENGNNDLELMDRMRVETERKLGRAVEDLKKLEQQQQQVLQSDAENKNKFAAVTTFLTTMSDSIATSHETISRTQSQHNAASERCSFAKQQLSQLQDKQQLFRQKISNQRDVLVAMDWLQINRNKLRGECYGPIGMHLDVADHACAAMVEKVVGFYGFLAFVVDNKEDEIVLRNELVRGKNLKLSIYTILNKDSMPLPYPHELLEDLRGDIGMQGYLIDQITMPALVKTHLLTWTRLAGVVWARGANITAKISNAHLARLCPPGSKGFTLYAQNISPNDSRSSRQFGSISNTAAVDITEFSGRVSRYANGPPSTSTVAIKPSSILCSGIDETDTTTKKRDLEATVAAAVQDMNNIDATIRNLRETLRTQENQLQKAQHEKNGLQQLLRIPQALQSKIDLEKRKIKESERCLSTDANTEKNKKLQILQNSVNNYLKEIKNLHVATREFLEVSVDKAALECLANSLQANIANATEKLQEAKVGYQQLRNRYQVVVANRDNAQKKCSELKEKMEKLIEELIGERNAARFKEVYEEILRKCPECDVDTVTVKIENLTAEINSAIDNPEIVARYELTIAKRDVSQKELEKLQKDLQSAQDDLQKRSQQWVVSVTRLAELLNVSFGEFMKELQYCGEVELKQVGRFTDYEMQMRVSFRADSGMAELSGSRHSGGERAVSTIMYLMALQSQTSSPFRVVDEINQGMDERNERLVFDRIVQSCCSTPITTSTNTSTMEGEEDAFADLAVDLAHKPQYFLVSPKLLQGLRAMDNQDVTVLMVWNGPGVLSKWQLSDIIKALTKRKRSELEAVGVEEQKNDESDVREEDEDPHDTINGHEGGNGREDRIRKIKRNR